jgi:cytochrome c oxidase assembly protein subunit 15
VRRPAFAALAAFTALVALCVVMLGAYVRLSDAGLGCPDWPGCYGQLAVPKDTRTVAAANAAYPERPLEAHKAWKEMAHRYLAGTLGLLILALAAVAWRNRACCGLPVALPTALVALVIFQALLGMWTVTLLVKPAVVTAHLLGGLATLSLLWWLALRQSRIWLAPLGPEMLRLRRWALFGLVLLLVQISLGGWTSSNYAALACTEFPTCQGGQWFPPADFREAFVLWRGTGVNYEFGVLDSEARTAIHLTHRGGALAVLLYLGALSVVVMVRATAGAQRAMGLILACALLLQLGLGIANILGHLPLPVAVAHNGGAAVLLLSLVAVIHVLTPPSLEQRMQPAESRGLKRRAGGFS